ncbi:hypothetical protein TNCV_2077351 [Trichonephila clavipes]|nr:hypothetical protein TNCV_2077351 [Trichonephila clavipes]
MLPFCPNDFDDNNITKIAARAEESRQLARVAHSEELKTKIVDVTIPNTKWYLRSRRSRMDLYSRSKCRTHKSRYQVPIAELAKRWTELPQVSGSESRPRQIYPKTEFCSRF